MGYRMFPAWRQAEPHAFACDYWLQAPQGQQTLVMQGQHYDHTHAHAHAPTPLSASRLIWNRKLCQKSATQHGNLEIIEYCFT